ncbi:restriction endonuclease subunit R [Gallibacterium salpingitidis]|uniref:Restriction endonuclease subunit R n=1 Tax=Gallibacterium salpingitidis TaxID=505341 RepID=A0AB36E4F2_9PAST|nr:DEAD/DEAH box helicase family protein [Gallibacterium salpingitidis]OBX11592.1 restriction endonuclease subunit R [Gallibacterium salpingitidis]WKS98997.1 DEAD/DEAH box helicase family protein [Gallibacterium salpingitidis]
MKLQFKHQKFQVDAAKAVVDVFAGQLYHTPSYMMDKGVMQAQSSLTEEQDFTGWSNQKIGLSDIAILENLQKVQRSYQLKPSDKLEGRYNLTIEMETGVGKTYTYIKTMYELNRAYGWSKFIVVVPSIAIREGVYKSFQITQEHFAEEYGKKVRFFIYDSKRLTEIDRFASDNAINVMIINAQAFNAKGKDARRIYMKLDEFRSRRPIDIIAKTNPIVIIDEPQSVEGKQTKENLKQFNPLMTLRYSATHKKDSIYNMVYRLDAVEAYNKRLVKKIAVKGIHPSGSSATESFVYLEGINLSKAAPTATIQFDYKTKTGVKKVTRTVSEGYNLYDNSGELEQYKDGFVVARIDGRDDSVEFVNGIKIYAGDVIGNISIDQLRRIQIRETIDSHIRRERELFHKGIKVLSLFFIDEVAKYKQYDEAGQPFNGDYATMFEEEYHDVIAHLQTEIGDEGYLQYLEAISADKTHAGYFSIDKKGRMIDSKLGRKETSTDDVDAYDLIMKNKELLLDRNPSKSPVRFIFSHSALREGWDNPNVFQICTLKQSTSDTRKRQEVGRGLRLCVNQEGERMDVNMLGEDVHNVNILTVIASESYDSFSKGLQEELAQDVADRPRAVTDEIFKFKTLTNAQGEPCIADADMVAKILHALIKQDYIDEKNLLTDKYHEHRRSGTLVFPDSVASYADSIITILDSVYDERVMQPENARYNNVELYLDEDKLAMPEFKALWAKINAKSVYIVDFETEELVKKSIQSLDKNLRISRIYYRVETGIMDEISSKEALINSMAFVKEQSGDYGSTTIVKSDIKYDLIGKLVNATGLTRKAIIQILRGIQPSIFNQFQNNPEEFILKASSLINDEKATAIIQHITYNVMDEQYGTEIFTDPTIKGRLDANAIKTQKHLYDHLIYDSSNEREFAAELDISKEVAVYVKLPNSFYISTPVGNYNPDWAIAFYQGSIKHIYFVAETKGSMNSMQLRLIEESKIHCAREHFKAISNGDVVYEVVDSYDSLLTKVMK